MMAPVDAEMHRSEDWYIILVYTTQCTKVGFKYRVLNNMMHGTYIVKIYLFQFVLSLSPAGLPARLVSGGNDLVRPLSSGKQTFETDKAMWPLTEPVRKLEAVTQCSGKQHSLF